MTLSATVARSWSSRPPRSSRRLGLFCRLPEGGRNAWRHSENRCVTGTGDTVDLASALSARVLHFGVTCGATWPFVGVTCGVSCIGSRECFDFDGGTCERRWRRSPVPCHPGCSPRRSLFDTANALRLLHRTAGQLGGAPPECRNARSRAGVVTLLGWRLSGGASRCVSCGPGGCQAVVVRPAASVV